MCLIPSGCFQNVGWGRTGALASWAVRRRGRASGPGRSASTSGAQDTCAERLCWVNVGCWPRLTAFKTTEQTSKSTSTWHQWIQRNSPEQTPNMNRPENIFFWISHWVIEHFHNLIWVCYWSEGMLTRNHKAPGTAGWLARLQLIF